MAALAFAIRLRGLRETVGNIYNNVSNRIFSGRQQNRLHDIVEQTASDEQHEN